MGHPAPLQPQQPPTPPAQPLLKAHCLQEHHHQPSHSTSENLSQSYLVQESLSHPRNADDNNKSEDRNKHHQAHQKTKTETTRPHIELDDAQPGTRNEEKSVVEAFDQNSESASTEVGRSARRRYQWYFGNHHPMDCKSVQLIKYSSRRKGTDHHNTTNTTSSPLSCYGI